MEEKDIKIYNSVFSDNPYLSGQNNVAYYLYKISHAYYEAEFLSIKCLGLLYEFILLQLEHVFIAHLLIIFSLEYNIQEK